MYMLDTHVVAVKAFVGTRFHPIKTDDCALAYLEMASGVPCSIAHAGFKDHPGAGIAQATGVTEISCTEAMLKVTDRRQLFRTVPGPQAGQYEEVPVERTDTTTVELARFVDCIRDDAPEPVTVEWARNVVAAMTACEESTRTGREVVIER